jgi:hypothetical protein
MFRQAQTHTQIESDNLTLIEIHAMIKLCKAILVLLFASIEVHSQQQITGKVIDFDTKKPVKDVSITVHGTDITTTSNILGYFQVMADTSDYMILEKPFYKTGEVKVSTNTGIKILFEKRKEAEYEGGNEELYHILEQSIQYPSKARIDAIQGSIYVSFAIDSLGHMNNIKLLKDIGDNCGTEVVKVLEALPKRWIPAETETTFILPVTFRIGDSKIKIKDSHMPTGILLDEIVITAR